ncbi:MAG: UbiA family prenyltransferase, partial [Candidatus Bilamarchaeaceae archaeon]
NLYPGAEGPSMTLLQKIQRAISISRPVFWLGPPLFYRVGLFIAGIPVGPLEAFEMLLLSFPFSFIIYGLNDLYDIEVDSRNPRKGGIWGAKLLKEDIPWVKSLIVFFSLLLLLTAFLSFNPVHFGFSFLMLAVPYIYSAPPFCFKSRPFWDSFLSGGYGVGPFLYGYSLSEGLLLNLEIFLFSSVFSGIHGIATIMDYEYDKKNGINTFAVGLGPRAPAFLMWGICCVNFLFLWKYSIMIAGGLVFCGLLSAWLFLFPKPENAKLVFKLLFLYVFAWGAYFFTKYVILGIHDFSEMEFQTLLPEILKHVRGS